MKLETINKISQILRSLKREEKKQRLTTEYMAPVFFLRMVLEGRNTLPHIPKCRYRKLFLYRSLLSLLNSSAVLVYPGTENQKILHFPSFDDDSKENIKKRLISLLRDCQHAAKEE